MPNMTVGTISGLAPTNALVGASSGIVVAENTSRVGLIITNISSGTVYLTIGQTAVLNSGIPLTPNGGAFSMDDYTYSKDAIAGIAHSAGNIVAIQEFVNRA